MKFGKLLQSWAASEANPAHGELFLRFKELKKTLKLIKPLEAGKACDYHCAAQFCNVTEALNKDCVMLYHRC